MRTVNVFFAESRCKFPLHLLGSSPQRTVIVMLS